jgi:hypothetical protein
VGKPKVKRTEQNSNPSGTIHSSINLLAKALEDLGAQVTLQETEHLAVMINEAMTAGARSFHTPEHVFALVDPGNPHTTLAALFHDLVYYQVDLGFIPQIAEAVRGSIDARDDGLWLRPRAHAEDRGLAICMAVFGVQAGQQLSPFGGMNEFLSALVMHRKLSGHLRERDLIPATACIEATIPFRTPDANGRTPAELLEKRLHAASDELGLALSRKTVEQAVQWAVTFANRDVANFSEKEVTRFLDNTWKLLPETNPSLRTQGVYSIRSYRIALQKMSGFLNGLDPATIFAQYHGAPPEKEYRQMVARGQRNIATARDYLGIKLLTSAVLEALAEISGGDTPISLFMGDIGAQKKGNRLEDYLPEPRPRTGARLDQTLRDLLAHGRASASSFDLQNSPLSLFIYMSLGSDGFRDFLAAAHGMFGGNPSPRAFLDSLPAEMVASVADGAAQMAFTRRRELFAYAAERRDEGRPRGRRPA